MRNWGLIRRRRGRVAACLAAALALLAMAAVGSARAEERDPEITLKWATKTSLRVYGAGWEPLSTVAVEGKTATDTGKGAVRADEDGAFDLTFSLGGKEQAKSVAVTAKSGTLLARAVIQASNVESPQPKATTTVKPKVTATTAPMAPIRPKGPKGAFKLIFNDEFSGNTLDRTKWNTCLHWGCDGANKDAESQKYSADNIDLEDGAAIFTLKKNGPSAAQPYTSGMVAAHPKHSFTYGYMEMRAKLPNCQGCWPAFWAAPGSLKWPPEIDVMERLTNESDAIATNYHWDEGGHKSSGAPSYNDPADMSKGYHTFGAEWSSKAIVWYVDGKEISRYDDAKNIADMPMYVMANLAIDKGRGSPPAGVKMHVDYIRVFQRP